MSVGMSGGREQYHVVDVHAVGCESCLPHSLKGLGYHYISNHHDWIAECRTCDWTFGPDPDLHRDVIRLEGGRHSKLLTPVAASAVGEINFNGIAAVGHR